MTVTRELFNMMLPMAQEYIKRLKLFWEKQNRYRKDKLYRAADVLTAAYVIHGGDEYRAQDKAVALALIMDEAKFDYGRTLKILAKAPTF